MTKKGYVHTEEQYLEMYTRLALEPEDFVDEVTFREKLRQQLWYEPSEAQFDAYQDLYEVGVSQLAQYGVMPKYIPTIAVGASVRYYIKGYRGAFGYQRMLQILEELMGM